MHRVNLLESLSIGLFLKCCFHSIPVPPFSDPILSGMIPEARRNPRKMAEPVSRSIQQKPLTSGKIGGINEGMRKYTRCR
jgi:hypothetical protein